MLLSVSAEETSSPKLAMEEQEEDVGVDGCGLLVGTPSLPERGDRRPISRVP